MNSRPNEQHSLTISMHNLTTASSITKAILLLATMATMGVGCNALQDDTTNAVTTLPPPPKGLPPVPTQIPQQEMPEPVKLENTDHTVRDANGNPASLAPKPLNTETEKRIREEGLQWFSGVVRKLFPDRQLTDAEVETIVSLHKNFIGKFSNDNMDAFQPAIETTPEAQAFYRLTGMTNLEFRLLLVWPNSNELTTNIIPFRETALREIRAEIAKARAEHLKE